MTRNETDNKKEWCDNCDSYNCGTKLCAEANKLRESPDPVASNTGKHIQCCVECYRNSVKRLAELESEWLKEVDAAHKRIAELEDRLNNPVLLSDWQIQQQKIASLESSLEGMKKQNLDLIRELEGIRNGKAM